MLDDNGRTLDIETAAVFEPLLVRSRYKGAFGGRGSAKSWFFGDSLIELFVMYPRLRWVCIREVQKSLEHSVKQLLEDRIRKHNVQSLFRVLDTHIETRAGGLCLFQGMQNHTADSIKSLEGFDGAWVEEGQTLSQRSLDLLRPTLRKGQVFIIPELWFSWNPEQPSDPVEFLRHDPPDNAIVVEANFDDNPWFPDVLRADMEYDKRRDPDRYAHVWLGKYRRHSEARVFRNWRIGTAEEFATLRPDRYYGGGDFGFSIDPTVLIRCFIIGRTLYIDAEAYAIGCDIDKTPFLWGGAHDKKLRELCPTGYAALKGNELNWEGVPGSRKWPLVADSSRPETISYLRRHGFSNIKPAVKGAKSIEEGIEFLKGYDIVIHPDCVHTIDEFTNYSFKVDPKTNEILPVLVDKKNHVIDSVRYAVEPLRRGKRGLL